MDEFERALSGPLDSTDDPISRDDVFAVLAARQRRRLLVALRTVETPARLSELARTLATETSRHGNESVERLHALLYHWHVPELADAGLVSYECERDAIDLTEEGRTVVEALDR